MCNSTWTLRDNRSSVPSLSTGPPVRPRDLSVSPRRGGPSDSGSGTTPTRHPGSRVLSKTGSAQRDTDNQLIPPYSLYLTDSSYLPRATWVHFLCLELVTTPGPLGEGYGEGVNSHFFLVSSSVFLTPHRSRTRPVRCAGDSRTREVCGDSRTLDDASHSQHYRWNVYSCSSEPVPSTRTGFGRSTIHRFATPCPVRHTRGGDRPWT